MRELSPKLTPTVPKLVDKSENLRLEWQLICDTQRKEHFLGMFCIV